MRIAVISDTHDRYPSGLLGRLQSADEIWHLGDVCEPATLADFTALGKPLKVILGNNESHDLWPHELILRRGGLVFYLIHIPPSRVAPTVNVVLHGHTHVPRDETDQRGVRWLNPGCITRPNRGAPPSFAWLSLETGRPMKWTLEPL